MTGLVLCEPTELYNILNQVTKLSRLTEPNYLCLLDVRTKREYDESHVMTALLVKKCSRPGDTVEYKLLLIPCSCISELLWCSGDRQLQILLGSPGFFRVWVRLPVLLLAPAENRSSALVYLTVSALSCSEIAPRLQRAGEYLIPESVDLECVKYCVVYDNNTSSLEIILKNNSDDDNTDDDNGGVVLGAALECGRALTHLTRHPVHILRGGYECFSAMYHFFRTQKSIWMPQELDAFQPYPVEIVPGKIYLGNFRQACDPKIQKDLKIKAHVNVSMETGPLGMCEISTQKITQHCCE